MARIFTSCCNLLGSIGSSGLYSDWLGDWGLLLYIGTGGRVCLDLAATNILCALGWVRLKSTFHLDGWVMTADVSRYWFMLSCLPDARSFATDWRWAMNAFVRFHCFCCWSML